MKLNKKIKIKTLSAYCLHKVFPFMSQNNRLGHSSTLRVRASQCAGVFLVSPAEVSVLTRDNSSLSRDQSYNEPPTWH